LDNDSVSVTSLCSHLLQSFKTEQEWTVRECSHVNNALLV